MNRRFLPTTTLALLLFAGLVGCGIPAESEVRVDGKGPQSGQDSGLGITSKSPARLDTTTPEPFAENYLTAAAGEANSAYKRVNDYIPPEGRRLRQKAGSEVVINVVRVIGKLRTSRVDNVADAWWATIEVQQVGVLRADGSVGEPEATETSYTFKVGKAVATVGDKVQPLEGLFVLEPPPVLLMSTAALSNYYDPRTIYFWNADRTTLVPDLRYLPLSVPKEEQATEVLNWLIAGPADWLAPAAVPLPEGTSRIGTVPQPSGRLEVNLSVPASEVDGEDEIDRLFNQLAWSLLEDPRDEQLELKIQSQRRKVDKVVDYRRAHRPYRLTGSPKRFCVYEGAVHPLRDGEGTADPVPIAFEANRNVSAAALAQDDNQVAAALVTVVGDRRRLRTATGVGTLAAFRQSDESYTAMGRPVWLKGVDPLQPIGLVVADGMLFRFDNDANLQPVTLPGISGPVASVGAALDGHRIAVIADKALYVVALSTDGGTVVAGRARRLVTSLHELTAVDWRGENNLALAGVQSDSPVIAGISVDGAMESGVEDNTGGAVTHLAAYPDNPLVSSSDVMYEVKGITSDIGGSISRDQVVPNPSPTPSTTPSTTPPAREPGKPSAPFFRY
jgi:hypothetical protein